MPSRFRVRIGITAVCATVISGCGGGSSETRPPVLSLRVSTDGCQSYKTSVAGTAPLTVCFDASQSTDPQGRPISYSWSFGDGTSGTGTSVTHTYQNHGAYSVSVTATDGVATANGSPSSAIQVSAAPPVVSDQSLRLNVLGVAPTSIQGAVVASDREKLPLTYSISTPPTAGTATMDAGTGKLEYTVQGFATVSSDSFVVTVSNGQKSSTARVSVALNGDPLLVNQWHIQNTGQDAFASERPVAGNDMNVAGAWATGVSGKGVKVAIVDTGLEAAHEDLKDNVDLSHSYNFIDGTNDPSRAASDVGFDHGTDVAGIVAAVAFNGKGGRGVAYGATLRGYNLLAAPVTVANFAKAMGADDISSDNDIFNESFGASTGGFLPPFTMSYQEITAHAGTLRGGLGAIYVQAAGNSFLDFREALFSDCEQSHRYQVSCSDPAEDERVEGSYPIVVGALDADGRHASYSNTGSSLWISAPGGEYGLNSAYVTGINYKPAIITTSRTGCDSAQFSVSDFPNGTNPLDSAGANPLAPNCQYTASMNGTSSAAPNVAAVVALMLEANPGLSVRDVKYILARTARKVDAGFAGIAPTDLIGGAAFTLEQGWVTNAAGYSFSNRYGFGGVDAAAAVAMARTYSSPLPAEQSETLQALVAAPAAIDKSAAGDDLNFIVDVPFQTVESAIVIINIDQTPGVPCNQIELISPSGTRSILLHAVTGFMNASLASVRLASHAFYGEPAKGTWRMRFYDICTGSATQTLLSTTQPQTLVLVGH